MAAAAASLCTAAACWCVHGACVVVRGILMMIRPRIVPQCNKTTQPPTTHHAAATALRSPPAPASLRFGRRSGALPQAAAGSAKQSHVVAPLSPELLWRRAVSCCYLQQQATTDYYYYFPSTRSGIAPQSPSSDDWGGGSDWWLRRMQPPHHRTHRTPATSGRDEILLEQGIDTPHTPWGANTTSPRPARQHHQEESIKGGGFQPRWGASFSYS